MEVIDKILEFLHYHPQSKRVDVENCISKKLSSATIKRILGKGIADGYIAVEGVGKATVYSITPKAHLLRTVDLDSYYAQDHETRSVQTGYNFNLIRETLPAVSVFSEEEQARIVKCREVFDRRMKNMTEGGYRKEMERLGIDLSWKSSEIEGNTYTLLETVNLLKDKIEAKGKSAKRPSCFSTTRKP